MSNILKYQNPSSPLLNPHKIIENIPAREWGPRKINEDYSITEGKGTNFWRAPFQYLGNKGLGVQNEKLARDLISEFDQMRSENPDYNYTLDKNYQSYDDAINYINHLEGLKKYLGLPYDTGLLMESKYKPTRLQGTNEKTYKFKSSTVPGYWDDVVEDMVFGEHSKNQYYDQSLNEFTAYRDRDEKGDFVSIYDEWDYNPEVRGGNKKLNKVIDSVTGGKPFVIYDRVYLDDYYDIPEEARGNPFITPAVVTAEAKKSGGIIKAQNSAKLISKINQSGANFVKRLLDPNRKSIPDWETKGQKIATHKMSWGEDDQGAYVFPEVQEIDDQLIDFSRPPYAPGIADYIAHKNNNIVRMSPEEADWFTRNYKQYYPSFKKGGRINIKKKNRGSFTRWCKGKVTEECIRRGKNSSNPAIRKKATFAANARRWKHENGGILKAQEGTGNLYAPHPLSPVGIALNQAKAMAKMKEEQQHLPPGVKEVIGPDGKKVVIRTEQPLVPLEQSIAEWLPGTGDVAEIGYIANDVKEGRYGMATIGAGLFLIPGAFGKILNKRRKTIRATNTMNDAVRKANTAEYINNIDDTYIDPVHLERVAKLEQITRFNKFAKKYGYPEITDLNISNSRLDELTKNMLERHNTYYRGVVMTPEVEELAKTLNISNEEALKIAATTPRKGESHVFVSPASNAGIYGGGTAAKIRRPYKLGPDRTKWFNEANFQIEPPYAYGGNPQAEVIYPWHGSYSETNVPNELLLKKGEFIEWMNNSKVDDYVGSNNRVFSNYDRLTGLEFLPLEKFKQGRKL